MAEKIASGIIVYLQEELGDARLRAQQLGQLIAAATELIEKSSHKDHFYEVAGHLLYGIPTLAFKLQKALDAAALAAARLDYEEIKQGLKPEKVEELEAALDDVRLRYLNRRSTEEVMNPKIAADILTQLAAETEATGTVPVAKLARFIAALERGVKRASDQPARAAATFRAAATHLKSAKNASRVKLAQNLRRILADSQMDPTAGAGEQFQKENPKITDEEVKKINEEHEKHKDVVKDKHAGLDVSTEDFLNDTEKDIIGMSFTLKQVMSGLRRVREDLLDDRNPHIKREAQKMISALSRLDSALAEAFDEFQNLFRLVQKGDPEFWDKEARSQRRRYAAQPWESRELQDMEDMLRSKGYDPADAKKLQSEGMGTYELEDRLKKRPGTDGSLDDTHGLKRKEARFETGKPADPTQNMGPEDADAWKDMNEKYRDVVKDMHKSARVW